MKYIDEAMERLRNKDPNDPNNELSLVERILANEPDPKMAYILALDLILVGIDTVSPINTSLSSTMGWKNALSFASSRRAREMHFYLYARASINQYHKKVKMRSLWPCFFARFPWQFRPFSIKWLRALVSRKKSSKNAGRCFRTEIHRWRRRTWKICRTSRRSSKKFSGVQNFTI